LTSSQFRPIVKKYAKSKNKAKKIIQKSRWGLPFQMASRCAGKTGGTQTVFPLPSPELKILELGPLDVPL
jgi:hypothetical protein